MVQVACAPPEDIHASREALSDILIDVVAEGAGLGFMPPMSRVEALTYWDRVAAETQEGTRLTFFVYDGSVLAGSAQLDLCMRPNGMHRAECQKVMVAVENRRRGLGLALMRGVEAEAARRQRTLLYLDTFAHQEARHMYEAAGWKHAGDIPEFSKTKEGTLGTTSLYFKILR